MTKGTKQLKRQPRIADRGVGWVAAAQLPRVDAVEGGQPVQASAGGQSGGSGFFRDALQKVEARRQQRGSFGEKASTTKSGR